MIVACPGCGARYQIEPDRVRSEGVRLRCSRCEAVFRVSPPPVAAGAGAAAAPAAHAPDSAAGAEARRQPAPSVRPPMSRPAPSEAPAPPVDRERAILIADPVVEQGKATASALARWGLQPTLVHDGVEAILAIQRLLPRAVVIDAALPKMFGFQVCEIVKRNESLRTIHVVLVGAIHDRTRYRRPPEEIYGADAYLEREDLPGSLRSILEGFGMLAPSGPAPTAAASAPAAMAPPEPAPTREAAPAPPASGLGAQPAAIQETQLGGPAVAQRALESAGPARPTPAAGAAPTPTPAASPAPASPATPTAASAATPAAQPSAPASQDPGTAEKIEQAERLARIVVSDIVLYSQDKFDAAVRAGNVLDAMQPEIAEGRALFAARVDPAIQEMRDFLTEELLRVAEARGKP